MLDVLPAPEFETIFPRTGAVALASGEVLNRPGERIARIYFPTTCVLSVVTVMQNGDAVEIGTYGREGMSGAPAILGSADTPSQMLCQVPGDALALSIEDFTAALATCPVLEGLVRRYTLALFNFMGQSVACNRLHETAERCARWLSLTRDRVATDDFSLTQEFLAIMLGVHRPSVSVAAAALQSAGFIKYTRGRVTVLDRAGLADVACECYRVGAVEFERALMLS
jgi:CRP-like cAMP-binding protein